MSASSDATRHLALPYLLPSQAQKHVTHNEALQLLDALVQSAVLDADRSLPPETPEEGQRHLVAADAGGAWAGETGKIAVYLGGAWQFLSPQPGWRVYDCSAQGFWLYDESGWQPPGSRALSAPRLSLGASADAVNRLAVAAPAVLLSHAGAGHQLKINKATSSDTASLLFQTNWSGRAEMGLAGQDDFSLKVSADGTSFLEALRIAGATGLVSGAGVTATHDDARAGLLARVGDFGLGRPEAPEEPDWDAGSSHVNGFRAASDGASGVAPTGAAGRGGLLLARKVAGVLRSLWLQHLGNDELALRGYLDGTPTGGWHRLYGEMNLLGSVSQKGGMPKGAVFETGSGANGSYHRHADGRLECRHVMTGLTASATTWTYPSAFAAPPVVSLTPVTANVSAAHLEGQPGTSTMTFSVRDGTGSRSASSCHILAVGRWF